MAILTEEMKRMVLKQRLGFAATVCPDGTPNLSPKGTILPWSDDQLVFADLRSPRTVENLRENPAIEINVIDHFSRKGFRFKGTATVLTDGPSFADFVKLFENKGLFDAPRRIQSVVLIKVERALPVISPGYDRGTREQDVRKQWEDYYLSQSKRDPKKMDRARIDSSWYIRRDSGSARISTGGVVARVDQDQVYIALVHERGISDLVLPKGGQEADETLEETARREILEEAGLAEIELFEELAICERYDLLKERWIKAHYFLTMTQQINGAPTDCDHHYGLA